jgi:hypothetical protein
MRKNPRGETRRASPKPRTIRGRDRPDRKPDAPSLARQGGEGRRKIREFASKVDSSILRRQRLPRRDQ